MPAFAGMPNEWIKAKPMASDTIVDIYCHIMPEKFSKEMSRIAPRLGNIAARLRGVKKLFDLDERFREMDQFGNYREIVALPNPPSPALSDVRRRALDDGRRRLGQGNAARGGGTRRRWCADFHQRGGPAAR
jgi:hypothetical protein